jgi:holo-[acyl-carrier protein] synthase
MILGTGIDLIEVARIASSFEKYGERFVNRILLSEKIADCLAHRQPAPFLAVRFAARGAQRLHVSLSHTEHDAAATAILEG